MRTVRYELLRPGELISERERCPVAYLPVGPLEWHSAHMPLGVDALLATNVALRTAERVGGVVLPTLYVGTERERPPEMAHDLGFSQDDYIVGMDFPANVLSSLYFHEEILALVLREYLQLLIRQKYKLIVVVNGHGALNHVQTLERVCKEFTAISPARVMLAMSWATHGVFEFGVGHADAGETSDMMALYPESVDLAQLPPTSQPLRNQDWAIVDADTFRGHPTPDHTVRSECDPRRQASTELGRRSLQLAVDELVEIVKHALQSLAPSRNDAP
jgi:creatinine amidohydrolase